MSFSSWSSCCISSLARQLSASPQASIILLLTQTHVINNLLVWHNKTSQSGKLAVPDNKYIKFFFFSPNQSLISQAAAALLHGLRQSRQGQLFLRAEQVRHAENADAHSQKCINHTPEFLSTPVPASGNRNQNQEQLYRSFLYTRTRNLSRVYLLHTKSKIQSEKYVQRVKSIKKK